MILVDAGPLVALLDRKDDFQETCVRYFQTLRQPPISVWPAITEAMFLLREARNGQSALLELLESGAVVLATLGSEDVPRIRELMAKYRDLPMDLADAALVRVAEREKIRTIFTLDRRDFALYRPKRIGKFRIVP